MREQGRPSELPTEKEVAAEAKVDLEYIDEGIGYDSETKLIIEKLREQGPHEIFGGFPTDPKNLVSIIDTLKKEWVKEGIPEENIKIVIHKSCANGSDCVTILNGVNAYHYNTGHIVRYDREQIKSILLINEISFIEK